MTFYISLLLALMQTTTFFPPRLERSASFESSLNTIGSSWVVLDLETGRQGSVQSIEILQGASPFLDAALLNIRQWIFTPASAPLPVESHVTVVFLFRPRDLFSSAPVQSSESFRRNSDRPPVPLELLDPGYPVASVGEGAAVLELQIAQTGNIERVRVVVDAAGLAAHTERALRSWKFQPAMRNGTAVIGNVIVVASYLRPMIYNNPPSTGGPYYPYSPGENPGSPVPLPPTFRDGRPAPPRF
jgi:hypothetical protein